MTCDREGCVKNARWAIYAATNENLLVDHPLVARFPAPLFKTCDDHLVWELGRDAASFGSTCQWVVKPA